LFVEVRVDAGSCAAVRHQVLDLWLVPAALFFWVGPDPRLCNFSAGCSCSSAHLPWCKHCTAPACTISDTCICMTAIHVGWVGPLGGILDNSTLFCQVWWVARHQWYAWHSLAPSSRHWSSFSAVRWGFCPSTWQTRPPCSLFLGEGRVCLRVRVGVGVGLPAPPLQMSRRPGMTCMGSTQVYAYAVPEAVMGADMEAVCMYQRCWERGQLQQLQGRQLRPAVQLVSAAGCSTAAASIPAGGCRCGVPLCRGS
jgi:hypothetical protein